MKGARPGVMALGLLVAALACDRSPTGLSRSAAPSASLTGALHEGMEFMPCSTLTSTATARLIGPAGGSMRIGPHTFRVPQGALAKPVLITAVLEGDDGYNKVQFFPHGLRFKTPAFLAMSYANCDVGDGSRLAYVQIVYKHADNIVEYEPSVRDLATQTVTGEISHFSNYAVAW